LHSHAVVSVRKTPKAMLVLSKTDPHIAKIPQPSLQNCVLACLLLTFLTRPTSGLAHVRRVLAQIQPHFALPASKMIIIHIHTAKGKSRTTCFSKTARFPRDSARKLLDAFVALR